MSEQKKTAIVTGAGSGIGKALSIMLLDAGWQVALVGRTRSKLEQVARKGKTIVLDVDLTEEDAAERIVNATHKAFGRIDALAHVAGDAPMMPIGQMTPQSIRQCLLTNLGAAAELTAAVWPAMVKHRGGVIAHVSSIASIDPFPGFSVYAAAKVGVNMFTSVIAGEGEPHNIRAVVIAPGAVDTPMLRAIFDEKAIPKEKTLTPEAVARVIMDCITGKRAFTSGETIVVPSP